MEQKPAINIFDYTDYRRFLKEFFQEKKSADKKFSYRWFARKIGSASGGFVRDVMTGRSNLSQKTALFFARALSPRKREQEYFQDMVAFSQATTIAEGKHFFEKMMRFYNAKVYTLERNQYEYFSKWHHAAIREMLFLSPFAGDYKALANSLNPSITAEDAKKSIQLLQNLNLIRRDDQDRFCPTETIVSTGSEVHRSLNAANFQRTMMELAIESIDRHPAPTRDVSCLTLSVSKECFDAIKSECVFFRKRILAMSNEVKGIDRVYQLNIQLFPLSRQPRQ